MKLNKLSLTPEELDRQSPIKIDKWLDIDSEECKDKDPDHALTKKWLKMCAKDNFLQVDKHGRVWGKGPNQESYFPYHFDYGKKKYGFRLALAAAN
jgi:hypothetical protein